jgi:uncharacterized protein
MLDTKFDELLEFPCQFPFKVIGKANVQLAQQVEVAAQKISPGQYKTETKTSSQGTYDSVTIKVKVNSKEQIESLYIAFSEIDGVKRVL